MKASSGKLFLPIAHQGGWITLGLAAFFSLITYISIALLPGRPISGFVFFLGLMALIAAILGIYFLYRSFALFRLCYRLNRNGLEIYWGATIQRIPIANIKAIVPAKDISLPVQHIFGFSLPPWWAGQWRDTIFYNTALPQESLVVQTDAGDYVISPQDLEDFIAAWQLRLPLGPTQMWSQEILRLSFFGYRLWFDPLARRLAGGAIILCLILIGATFTAYASWPDIVPVRVDADDNMFLVQRQQLLWIPGSGAMILIFNLILGSFWYRKEPIFAYLLWGVAILVQIGLWVGIAMLVG